MRLLVVSHTPHYRTDLGLAGWGATVRELDQLARLFKRVVHLAPIHGLSPGESAPGSSRVYRASNLKVRPLTATGGPRLADKIGILTQAPSFLAAFLDEASRADVIHVRTPANIALLALVARCLAGSRLRSKSWWVKYAGNWRPDGETARREAFSYRIQRAMLRKDRGWAVTVNGRFPGDGPHIRPFLNPSLSDRDLKRAQSAATLKKPGPPWRFLFVGRLDEAKGAGRALEILARSADAEIAGASIDFAGDGPERARLESRAEELGVEARFHGWLPRHDLDGLYAEAHVILLPSLASEGWPKVLSEAMAWGVVPVASAISAIPGIFEELGVGRAAPARDIEALSGAVSRVISEPADFRGQSRRAAQAAAHFTYGHYLRAVHHLFQDRFGLELASSVEPGDGPGR